MDNKKFEQLIDLIINENEEQARELFHEIVVEKSREIYESIMDEEMMGDMDEGMHGQTGQFMDEIAADVQAEEAGDMTEEIDEPAMDDFESEEEVEIDGDDLEGDAAGEEVEDAVVRIEDKLDQLMAEFEALMQDKEDDGADDLEDAGDEEGDEEGDDDSKMMEADVEEEAEVMEAVQLQKVSVSHGDNGSNPKSIALHEPKIKTAGVNPVKFSGHDESVPTGPKGPSNAYSKGETQVKGAGSFKNAPGAGNFNEKGESTPKPVTKDEAGAVKSPVAESKKTVKKIVK